MTEDEIVGWQELMTEVACRQFFFFFSFPWGKSNGFFDYNLEEFGGFFLTLTIKTERGSLDFLHDIH